MTTEKLTEQDMYTATSTTRQELKFRAIDIRMGDYAKEQP